MYKHILNLSVVIFMLNILFACTGNNDDSIQVAPIFGDNMVLQQGKKVPVWGTSTPGSKVEVRFRTQKLTGKTDKNGKWMVWLEPLDIADADSMVIKSRSHKVVLSNVLVGEVWLCSGQSNMEMNVGCTWASVHNSEEEIRTANYPRIRLFIVDRNTSTLPKDTLTSSGWKECSPQTVGDVSAVGYFFCRDIYNAQHIPIGLIQSAWGGTVAEAWTSGETLKNMKDFAGIVHKIETMPKEPDMLHKQYENDITEWLKETAMADVGIKGDDTVFAKFDFDHSEWIQMQVPGMWETTDIGAIDGVVWFRKEITIAPAQTGKDLVLTIAPPDDADQTWFNGVKIGESKEWEVVRHYKVPSEIVRKGKNIIAVRLFDDQGNGGFMGEAKDFSLFSDDGWKMDVSGKWHIKKGFDKRDIKEIPLKPDDPNRPTVLFNGMINPLIPYGIRGVIWYQGESNTGRAEQYKELFPALIKDWRKHWENGDFPFYFVQLANYMQRNTSPVDDPWAELREAQRLTLKEVPSSGMAVTIDIGDANDIHPGNKQDVGKRLSLIARHHIYGEDIPYNGPMVESVERKDASIEISFHHVYEGLKTSDNKPLAGFTIAGEDGRFFEAKASINDKKVIINSVNVPTPFYVRYGWSSNPYCNLINSANLPASPFESEVK